jgi:hypothetical protein
VKFLRDLCGDAHGLHVYMFFGRVQLGVGKYDHRPLPVCVDAFGSASVLAVAAGKWHTAALKDDASLLTV